MTTTLGGYIRDQRVALGFRTQGDFAEYAGINRAHLSQIESGKIALPNADLRRRLAKALGVSHIDILVAARELEPEEVEAAGVQGVTPSGPIDDLCRILHEVQWGPAQIESVRGMLMGLRDHPVGPVRGNAE